MPLAEDPFEWGGAEIEPRFSRDLLRELCEGPRPRHSPMPPSTWATKWAGRAIRGQPFALDQWATVVLAAQGKSNQPFIAQWS